MMSFFRCAILAAVCCLVSFVLFAPKFYLWHHLGCPFYAETDRAAYELVQLMDPFINVPDPGNQFLEWRLLFPVTAHHLHLPWNFYFALPMIFCYLMVLYVCHLCYRKTKSTSVSLAGAALTSTFASYFVSMGFLGYFDSALLLALLIASFERSAVVIWAAASMGPWIDERFIYALPIALWCQWVQNKKFSAFFPLTLGVAPYLGLRLFALFQNTDFSQTYFKDMARFAHKPWQLLDGVRDSLRWAWVLVLAALTGAPGLKRIAALTIIPIVLTTLALSAGDYSRSLAVAFPMALIGLFWLWQKTPRTAMYLVLSLAALNFITPAYHSFRAFHTQIKPLAEELKTAQKYHP